MDFKPQGIDADLPVPADGRDRLNFMPIAEKLAAPLIDRTTKAGWVLGIEGKWGSGKSTLVGFLEAELIRQGVTKDQIVRFSPWLIGSRDVLLGALFAQLGRAASKIEPLPRNVGKAENRSRSMFTAFAERWRERRRLRLHESKVRSALRRYGKAASRLGKLGPVADAAGASGAGILGGSILERLGDLIASLGEPIELAAQKEFLIKILGELSKPIVVLIDDLDRLEPNEAVEVLRLVRAVAEFPNVFYVLSYEPKAVGRSLRKALGGGTGADYLEKFVQASFRVPLPAAFDLRHWFREEVTKLFFYHMQRLVESDRRDVESRLVAAVDTHGGRYLETPRDVVRTLNALRLCGIPVADQVDIADIVWLQLVRIGKPELYHWIENYMRSVAALADGAHIADATKKRYFTELKKLLEELDVDIDEALGRMGDDLPGISHDIFDREAESQWKVLHNIADPNLRRFVAQRRLGSPHHYSWYFSFTPPEGAIPDDDVAKFVTEAAAGSEQPAMKFRQLAHAARPRGGIMAEQLLDRLLALDDSRVPLQAIPGLLMAVVAGMDDAAKFDTGEWGRSRTWDVARRFFEVQFKRLGADQRKELISKLFGEGASIGWLTHLLRDQTFDHGYFGERAIPESSRTTSPDEFELMRETMLHRFSKTDRETLLNTPQLISVLFGWSQAGAPEAAAAWVTNQIATDNGLLEFLSKARSWASSNDKVYRPLNGTDLKHFMNVDGVEARLMKLASTDNSNVDQRKLAEELLDALRLGRRDRMG